MTSTKIFVFGSNLAGIHGAGAALTARHQHGALLGVAEGRTGNAYAIPTKDRNMYQRPLADVAKSVQTFIEYAAQHSELTFEVTRVGCGLAGFDPLQIIPLFKDAPDNCALPLGWRFLLEGAPFVCRFCGAPSWVHPADQTPPPDYCHEGDHTQEE